MQRMSARVFTYILVDDAETYTAAEIAEGLASASPPSPAPCANSSAAGCSSKGRRASTRADVYRLHDDDIWGSIMLDRGPTSSTATSDTAIIGIETLPEGPAATGSSRPPRSWSS